jgi:hypothetical protein
MREERTVRRIVGAVVGTRRGRESSRGGRWVPGLPVVDGREVRADQCLHIWQPLASKERGAEACVLCPATCHRGDDGKIESYSAGLAAPERGERQTKAAGNFGLGAATIAAMREHVEGVVVTAESVSMRDWVRK